MGDIKSFKHPFDKDSGRYICSTKHPMPDYKPKGSRWIHPDAYEVGEQLDGWPAGDIQTMYCPNCGIDWEMELPQ
ncbi:MAG: hypothetical protein PVH88_02015 [Ignavibacteria bacterium]